MAHEYHIAYKAYRDNTHCDGNINVFMTNKIQSPDCINKVRELINEQQSEDKRFDKILIMFFGYLRDNETSPGVRKDKS